MDGIEEDQYEVAFRRKALRDASLCIACTKFISVIFYAGLGFMVHLHMRLDDNFLMIFVMMIVALVSQIILGSIIVNGALQESTSLLFLSLWLGLLIGSYNTVLGIIGTVINLDTNNRRFVLAFMFAVICCSIFVTLCHDMIIIFAFIKVLEKEHKACNSGTNRTNIVSTCFVQNSSIVFTALFKSQFHSIETSNPNFAATNNQLVQSILHYESDVTKSSHYVVPCKTDESCDLLSQNKMKNLSKESNVSKFSPVKSSGSLTKQQNLHQTDDYSKSLVEVYDGGLSSESKPTCSRF